MANAIFRDFTKKRPPVYFNIGEERFHCFKALGPRKLQRAINAFRAVQAESKEGVTEGNVGQLLERVTNTMIFFLKPESYKRFDELLKREDDDELASDVDDDDYEPVDVHQLIDILTWLLGDIYGARPTKPSSDSSTTSESGDGGTSSTAGAPPEELIHSS